MPTFLQSKGVVCNIRNRVICTDSKTGPISLKSMNSPVPNAALVYKVLQRFRFTNELGGTIEPEWVIRHYGIQSSVHAGYLTSLEHNSEEIQHLPMPPSDVRFVVGRSCQKLSRALGYDGHGKKSSLLRIPTS